MNEKELNEDVVTETSEKELKKYTYEEAKAAAEEYFNGDELAAQVWVNKYALKDSYDNIYELTPDDMHHRIAKEIARIEKKYPNPMSEEEIYDLLKGFKRIVPQGSPMAGIGNNFQFASLSNCFVIGSESDSYGGICKLDQELVQLMKRRAGVGLDISFIRPSGSPVKNTALTSTGVVPFMERYSNSTREVAQDGRRGALMETISIFHPDVEGFIDAKMDDTKVTGANVSVRLDGEFMNAVKNNEDFILRFPIEIDPHSPKEKVNHEEQEYNILYEGELGSYKKIKAKELWDKIIENAHSRAEPGLLFWDNIMNESVPDGYADYGFKTTSTNPCGEITLSPYDSCRLTIINLYNYVANPFQENSHFKWKEFKADVKKGQRIMDDIIDLEIEKVSAIIEKIKNDPEPEEDKIYELNLWNKIKMQCQNGRRTGLGVTAEGDMLAALGYTYGTDEANKFSEKVHRELKYSAYESSVDMAEERGAFPVFDSKLERNSGFLNRIKKDNPKLHKRMSKVGRRNISLLTIAPCGSVSILTQTTSGIECAFLTYYKRRRKVNPNDKNSRIDFVDKMGDAWMEYPVFHHHFATWLEANGYDVEEVKEMKPEDIDKIVKKSPYHKATSNDVDWVKKVEMQGLVQKHVDHSISVTVNLPEEISVDKVGEVYMKGWESGCKGVTVYREGSRSGVLISNKEEESGRNGDFKYHDAPKRPEKLNCDIHRLTAIGQRWMVLVGLLQEKPYEIFAFTEPEAEEFPKNIEEGILIRKKSGHYNLVSYDKRGNKHEIDNIVEHMPNDNDERKDTRKYSAMLRHGMAPKFFVKEIEKSNSTVIAFDKAIARTIKKYLSIEEKLDGVECQECGSTNVTLQEGCATCLDCGSSKCN